MKLSVSAYRAHASAHKKILDTAYQLNYGSTSHQSTTIPTPFKVDPLSCDDPPTVSGASSRMAEPSSGVHQHHLAADNSGSDTPVTSPRSPLNTSRDEDDDSSNAPSSECKSPSQRSMFCQYNLLLIQSARDSATNVTDVHLSVAHRTKSNQRWMKLRTTVQLSSAIQKKPPLKREDSFMKRFSTRQIPETQETVEDTGSEGGGPAGGGQTAPRRRRRLQKHNRTVVNPDENFYFYWLLALTVCVLYNMWTLIVRQSFPEFQTLASNFWFVCDALSDIVFLCDVGVQLRTGYLEQGLMVYDSRKLAGHYLHSRPFLLDLGALCPLDLLQVRLGPQPMLRFPRFLKVYRAVNYYYMVESRTVWPNLWRVVNLIHILLILAHWFGCFYFLLSEAEGFQGDWVYPYRPGDYATLTRKYLGSLYWSTLTLTTIGDLPTPETNAEQTVSVDGPKSLPRRGLKSRLLQFNTDGGYVFTIVSYLIGVFIFATIVGQVGNVITNRNANRLEFERLLDGAKTYMRHHKVPSGMKKRVLRWYDYSWSRGRIQGGGDINTALGLLPDKLKTELALHVNLSVLKKVTIFQECQPEFLHDLVLKMKAYIFTPGDSICRKGEVAREMFIIADGILEVLSETGRVLTSMKAGDFFGEIGILNLDGLNKRTADVRSVGYSELFSLSREDVLAAMKDYPEAQEILQALGRKRLMEVRNSARHPHHQSGQRGSKRHRGEHGTGGNTGDGGGSRSLVGKLKSEAKGLRNALRKSRAHRRSDESLELQPLHTSGKGVLRRMPRVRSDEMSQEDAPDPGGGLVEAPVAVGGSTLTSPLGAGLPLLSRLRLLKEKQDNEDRASICLHASSGVPSPSSAITSPAPHGDESHEIIGAGLPLLQRLLLLKAKEDRASLITSSPSPVAVVPPTTLAPPAVATTVVITSSAASTTPVTTISTFSNVLQSSRSPSPSPGLSPKPVLGKVSFRDRIFAMKAPATLDMPKKEPQEAVQTSPAPAALTELSVVTTPDLVKDAKDTVVNVTNDSSPCRHLEDPLHAAKTSSLDSDVTSTSDRPWSKLKQAAIVRDNSSGVLLSSTANVNQVVSDVEVTCASVSDGARRTKPALLNLQAHTKHYESVDDLSPEYCGLPFVKKLKILNERQKLAELESAMKTRSVSLDMPESQQPYDMDTTLTRSHSEASAMHRRNSTTMRLAVVANQTPTSPESNETPERRNLKSILKKLTEDVRGASPLQTVAPAPAAGDVVAAPEVAEVETRSTAAEMRQLMRAPTVEGYAARHSSNHVGEDVHVAGEHGPQEKSPPSAVPPSENQNKMMKDEHEYFGEALVAIKQVISAHLHEMQLKFQQRFDRLEQEVHSRDIVIGQLRQHIHDLEKCTDDSTYTGSDSIDTVIARTDRRSWDEPNNQECLELQELPESMRPQQAWSPTGDLESVVLDLDSTTDTESDLGDSSEPGEDADDTYLHNTNWEVELLAAQMRQQRRSASFDQNSSTPRTSHTAAARRRLSRGYSAEAGGRD
ncbi:Cyclic nucleotide-gated ion channel-like [Carabus blaptoides fortunei]